MLKNPPGELTDPIHDNVTNITYNYRTVGSPFLFHFLLFGLGQISEEKKISFQSYPKNFGCGLGFYIFKKSLTISKKFEI